MKRFVVRCGAVLAVLALILAGAAQWALVRRAHDVAAGLIARLVPYGDLRYERLWPWPWGAGHAWNLGFEPQGLLRLNLRAPPGMRVEARELVIHELRSGAHGQFERLRGRLLGVRVPLAPPSDAAWPTLSELGYSALVFDLDFDLRYVAAQHTAHLRLDARARDLGQARLDAQLEGTPQQFDRAPDQVLVRGLELQLTDGQVLARLKALAAERAGLQPAAWEASMIRQLDRRTAKWKWDAATVEQARRAIRDPRRLHLRMRPPGPVLLRSIRLYPMADWPPLLGFSIVSGGAQAHGPDH